jgi:hypothetical protein
MGRLVKTAEIQAQIEINGKDVLIYNNFTDQEIKAAAIASPDGSINGLITDNDIYAWPGEFSGLQVKANIQDNFETGYQFNVSSGNMKVFKNGPIVEDELWSILTMYYGYLVIMINVASTNLIVTNYVDGDGTQDPSYETKLSDFLSKY